MPSTQSWKSKQTKALQRTIHSVLRRWASLIGIVLVVAVVWLIVLPWIGEIKPLRDRIASEKARGINPDAMFYTELEIMKSILDRIDRTAK